MRLQPYSPPKAPDQAIEIIALIVAVVFFGIICVVAAMYLWTGRDASEMAIIAALGVPQIVIALVAWFVLRRRRISANLAKSQFYENLRNG